MSESTFEPARLLRALVVGLAAFSPRAQEPILLTTTAGERLQVRLVRLAGQGAAAQLVVRTAKGERSLPLSTVLGLHGRAPRPSGSAVVRLVGGDELRGAIEGGDAAGETFVLRSPTLGPLTVRIDRMRRIEFVDRIGAGARAEMRVPEDADAEEALFRKAERGFDTILGAIHRFEERGVLFEWTEGEEPRLYPYDTLAGIALAGGEGPPAPMPLRLVTRSGDVLGVELRAAGPRGLRLRAEGGVELRLDLADVSALTWMVPGRWFLSDLQPVRVEERGSHLTEGAVPLYRHRADRSVTGGFLAVEGRAFGKGLGTHSRCVLTYRVPDGAHRFWTMVGLDDEVLQLPVRAAATVSVRYDGKVVFGPKTVQSGGPLLDPGVLRVEPGKLLTLEVDFGPGWFLGDRVDWPMAVFLR